MGWKVVGCLGALLLATGCGGAATSGAGGAQSTLPAQQRSGKTSASGTEISKQAAQGYKQALDDFLKHDQAYDWSPATCKASAEAFVNVSKRQEDDAGKPLPEALYNAGLAYMRCGLEEEAATHFQAASKAGRMVSTGWRTTEIHTRWSSCTGLMDLDLRSGSFPGIARTSGSSKMAALARPVSGSGAR